MRTYDAIMLAGARFERDVAEELTARGYDVVPFGLRLVPERARRWLRDTGQFLRYMPDFLVHDGRTATPQFVDAKAGDGYLTTGRHDVQTASVQAAASWEAATGLPVWFLFRDGGCVRPATVLAAGTPGPTSSNGSGKPYLLFPALVCTPADVVFPKMEGGAQ